MDFMRPRRTEPLELDVEQDGDDHVLTCDGKVLLTSIGKHRVNHPSPALIEHMIGEFMRFPEIKLEDDQIVEPQFLGSYRLFGLQKEFVETGTDNLTENFALALLTDPLLHGVAGPESRDLAARFVPIERWLARQDLRLVDIDSVNLDTIDGGDQIILSRPTRGIRDTQDFHRLAGFLLDRFNDMTPEERAAVVYLHNGLDGAVIHAIGLVLGEITPNEFAAGVGGAQRMLDEFPDVSSDTHSTVFQELQGYASSALDYITAYRNGTIHGRVLDLIANSSESTDTEFKSTLRWNIVEGRKDRTMTDAVIKTVAAFLNTNGGTLLIGVDDHKSVVGIEIDGFASDDDFLLHLYQSVQNALGPAATPLVLAHIVDTGRGRVCIVDCHRGTEPFVCNTRQYKDAFFVRAGPRTDNLAGAQRDEFLRRHWGPTRQS
jgi:hypothetical protein